jgi:hypothetical protein
MTVVEYEKQAFRLIVILFSASLLAATLFTVRACWLWPAESLSLEVTPAKLISLASPVGFGLLALKALLLLFGGWDRRRADDRAQKALRAVELIEDSSTRDRAILELSRLLLSQPTSTRNSSGPDEPPSRRPIQTEVRPSRR